MSRLRIGEALRKRVRAYRRGLHEQYSRAAVKRRTASRRAGGIGCPPLLTRTKTPLEALLRLWDEMDDWLYACRHLLRSQLT